jgi:hypothetical protein
MSRSGPIFASAWHKFGAWDRRIPAFAIQARRLASLKPNFPHEFMTRKIKKYRWQ